MTSEVENWLKNAIANEKTVKYHGLFYTVCGYSFEIYRNSNGKHERTSIKLKDPKARNSFIWIDAERIKIKSLVERNDDNERGKRDDS